MRNTTRKVPKFHKKKNPLPPDLQANIPNIGPHIIAVEPPSKRRKSSKKQKSIPTPQPEEKIEIIDDNSMKWVEEMLNIRKQVTGSWYDKLPIRPVGDVVWLIDDNPPRLIEAITTKKNKPDKNGDIEYIVEIAPAFRKDPNDIYRLKYPSWVLFKKQTEAQKVYKRLLTFLNTN